MTKQYFAANRQKLIYTILGIFFLTFLILPAYATFESWFTNALDVSYRITSPVIFFISFYGMCRCFHRGYFETIIISEKGMEYNILDYVVNVKWDSMIRIGAKWDGTYKSWGLFASDYSMRKKTWLPNMFKETFIPLSFFSPNWRASDLGQQIKQHAPHLFS
ncbi:MAG: hypothetical protein ACOY0R_01770 [Chloroflexota bacterium]